MQVPLIKFMTFWPVYFWTASRERIKKKANLRTLTTREEVFSRIQFRLLRSVLKACLRKRALKKTNIERTQLNCILSWLISSRPHFQSLQATRGPLPWKHELKTNYYVTSGWIPIYFILTAYLASEEVRGSYFKRKYINGPLVSNTVWQSLPWTITD